MTREEWQLKLKQNSGNPYLDRDTMVLRNLEVTVDYVSDLEARIKELESASQELINFIHNNAVEKGFWQPPETEREKVLHEATALALIGTEAAEALEAHRCGDDANLREELADIVIRVMDYCGYAKIDLDEEIRAKMEKNLNRPPKHGKRY